MFCSQGRFVGIVVAWRREPFAADRQGVKAEAALVFSN